MIVIMIWHVLQQKLKCCTKEDLDWIRKYLRPGLPNAGTARYSPAIAPDRDLSNGRYSRFVLKERSIYLKISSSSSSIM
jgi:hypothetical protein